ncbi:aquaporin [Streptococcus chenjunshii]|uniref:Aquaporin n=1 Tax=Streptococcus chenjunshii TaxID=2173853 RepID=A0A372KLK4_9STRE|nr:aquaporin [Streptococcus chenjunshii]AXQ79754.1 aquaporin [Streptococcus chenjunshii]RFU51289.1 aquaporin [Streptococcus chenjunshii]RFU53165.1 aquaporin [Streptococcus chenjunshii]
MKKFFAELIGTFILVFVGTSAAVFGGGSAGIGITGIALAFGLTIVASAYSIGTVSGAHLNPAVSIALFINKRINSKDLLIYICAQIIGALLGSFTLQVLIANIGVVTDNLGQNLFNGVNAVGAFLVETILTFIFVLVIVTVTSAKKGNANLAGLIIGLTLTLIHFVGIPLTGMSANPARSLAPALLTGGDALGQLWVFILAPILGAVLAALVGRYLLGTEEHA